MLTVVDTAAFGGSQTQTFSYDALNRLLSAQVTGGSYGTYAQRSYVYNNAGNITSFEGAALGYNDAAHKHAVTHVAGAQRYWYDANGNATRRISGSQDISLTYDTENRLTGVVGNGINASYVYDGDGKLVKSVVNGLTSFYPYPELEVIETDPGVFREKYYMIVDGARLSVQDRSAWPPVKNYWLLGDHLGSTAITVDGATSNRATELRYYPYCSARYNAGSQLTNYWFTGQRRESNTGLYFYQSRWYDPYLNRWIQPDTIVPDPGNPQSLNRYSYVLNNPLRYSDSSGHCGPLTPVCVILALLGTGLLLSGDDTSQPVSPEVANSARLGGALLVTAVGVGSGSAIVGSASTAQAATAGAGAACADGNCTNEAQAVIRGSQNAVQSVQSVWKLDPLKRGQEIERMLGRSPQLSQNFPVIDRFENGVATSIKSIDLGARSYQNMGTLTSTVRGYVNELANWQGVRQWGGVSIDKGMITARELQLAIPQGATDAQLLALRQLQQWASTIGVTISWTAIP